MTNAPDISTTIVESCAKHIVRYVGKDENPDAYIIVRKETWIELAEELKNNSDFNFDFLESISGVDDTEKLSLVYHLFSYKHRHSLVVKIEMPYDQTEVDSVSSIWAAANWHEREQFDLFGFVFKGHPDLRRLLLPEDWDGHPLLKNYVFPEDYHGIDHYRPDPKVQFKALDDLAMKAAEKAAEKTAKLSNEQQN